MSASCSLPQTGTSGSQSLWTNTDLDVVDALVQKLGKRERSSFRLVCTAWKSSIDCCIRELRPQLFMPKELAASFKAINRLDLHALDSVTDKQLQDLAAAQHIPQEENLLAEALRKLHGGSICSRSECPSVTGSLSRAESFDMDDATSEATCTSSTAAGMAKQQLTPLRRRMNLSRRAAASLHSSKPSMESIGSPVMSTTNKSSSSCLWPPPKAAADHVDATTPSSPTPHTLPDLPSCSQSPFMPAVALGDVPPLLSFHSATSFDTGSRSSSQQLSQPRRPRSACQAKRPPHPQSQARMRLAEESIGAPQPAMISAHRPPPTQAGAAPEPALAWLTSLNISQCDRVTDAGMAALAGLTTLEELDMSCCTFVNRPGFAAIATLPHLSSLNVAKVTLSVGSLESIGCMTGLQQLSATLCEWTTAGQPLATAVGKLTKLTNLRLSNSLALQDQELAALLSNLTSLQRLDLADCFKLTETGMQNLELPLHLTALQLSRVAVNDTAIREHICKLTSLKHLSLLGCHHITDSGLSHLAQTATELQVLDISSCRQVTDDGLSECCHLQKLQVLVMNNLGPGVSGSFLSRLQVPTTAQHRCRLTLCSCYLLHRLLRTPAGLADLRTLSCASCTGFVPAAAQALAGMHGLQELNLRGVMPSPGTVHCLTALQALTGVEALNLAKWPIGVGQEQAIMRSLGNHMWRLTQLDLADSLVSSKGLRELPILQHLARLSLKCCINVNDQALKAVGQITSLMWLNLHYCKAVSDKGLRHLASAVQLVHLDIGFCNRVTDRGVTYLATLPHLTHVRMAGCHRIKLYQESQELSAKVDVRLWAGTVLPPTPRMSWTVPLQRMICACGSVQSD